MKNKKQPLYTLSVLLKKNTALSLKYNKRKNKEKGIKATIGLDTESQSSNYLNVELGEYKDSFQLFNSLNTTLEEYEYDLSSFINNNHSLFSTSIDNQQSTTIATEIDTSEMKESDHINKVYKSIEAKFI